MAKKNTRKQTKAKRAKRPPVKRAPGHGSRATKKIPAEQGLGPKRADVGYGKPPVEHQFAPGESGNPAGPPKARSNLWRYFCAYLQLTPKQIRRLLRRDDLSLAERAAVKQVQQLAKKGLAGCAWLATKEAWDRDEGRASQHVKIDTQEALTPEECEEIRQAMKMGGK